MLQLWNPLAINSLDKSNYDKKITVQDYFDRLWDNTINNFYSDFSLSNQHLIDSKVNEDGTINIFIDVPGIKSEDISMQISNRIISIKAERKGRNSKWSLNKSFSIQEIYDEDSLKAELSDGVLTLTLNKLPEKNKEIKKIEIQSIKK